MNWYKKILKLAAAESKSKNNSFLIRKDLLGNYEAYLKRLNKKYPNSIMYSIGEPVQKQVRYYSDKGALEGETPREFYPIEVQYNLPDIEGWEVLGMIEHAGDPKNNIVTNFISGSQDVPKKFWNSPPNCNHCNTLRKRNMTYILFKEDEADKYRQIGSTCLNDFTKGVLGSGEVINNITSIILSMKEAEDEGSDFYGGGGGASVYSLERVLALANAAIERFGYIKSSESGSTKDFVMRALNPNSKDPTSMVTTSLHDREVAAKCIELVKSIPSEQITSGYEQNMYALANADVIESNKIGYVVSMPVFAMRKWPDEFKLEYLDVGEDEEMPEITGKGQKILGSFHILNVAKGFSDYGEFTKADFNDRFNRKFSWKSSGAAQTALQALNAGDNIILFGTVSFMDTRRSITYLTRCKILDPADEKKMKAAKKKADIDLLEVDGGASDGGAGENLRFEILKQKVEKAGSWGELIPVLEEYKDLYQTNLKVKDVINNSIVRNLPWGGVDSFRNKALLPGIISQIDPMYHPVFLEVMELGEEDINVTGQHFSLIEPVFNSLKELNSNIGNVAIPLRTRMESRPYGKRANLTPEEEAEYNSQIFSQFGPAMLSLVSDHSDPSNLMACALIETLGSRQELDWVKKLMRMNESLGEMVWKGFTIGRQNPDIVSALSHM
jgi:hypothetical protein